MRLTDSMLARISTLDSILKIVHYLCVRIFRKSWLALPLEIKMPPFITVTIPISKIDRLFSIRVDHIQYLETREIGCTIQLFGTGVFCRETREEVLALIETAENRNIVVYPNPEPA